MYIGLNIDLDLWSQLTHNFLMFSDLLDLVDYVKRFLHDLTNQGILPFISTLEVDRLPFGQMKVQQV